VDGAGPRPEFRIGETLSVSWRFFADRFGVLFLGHLAINLIISTAFSVLPFVGGILLMGPMWYGLCQVSLAAVRGEPVKFEDIFAGFRCFQPTFIVGLLMTAFGLVGLTVVAVPAALATYVAWTTHARLIFSLTFGVGGALCLLPLCAVVVLYSPAFFFVYDHKMDAWAAMEASRKMVSGNLGQWLNLWVGLSILHLCGLLLCCVGLYVATPWMVVALALAYQREKETQQGVQTVP
jgi:uncharacterized membrane protein